MLHEQRQIYQKRLQQSELIQHETKWILEWQNIPIGDLYFPDPPTPLREIRNYKINWKKVDLELKKQKQLIKIKPLLIQGFYNDCGCGTLDLNKEQYISHVETKHSGIIPIHTTLNKPYWIYGINFYDDEAELLYCRTLEDLT